MLQDDVGLCVERLMPYSSLPSASVVAVPSITGSRFSCGAPAPSKTFEAPRTKGTGRNGCQWILWTLRHLGDLGTCVLPPQGIQLLTVIDRVLIHFNFTGLCVLIKTAGQILLQDRVQVSESAYTSEFISGHRMSPGIRTGLCHLSGPVHSSHVCHVAVASLLPLARQWSTNEFLQAAPSHAPQLPRDTCHRICSDVILNTGPKYFHFFS